MRLSRPLVAITLCLLALCCSTAPAGAAGSGVRVGTVPQLPAGAALAGTVAPERELHLFVALEPRDPAALDAFAEEVSTPGSAVYGDYLSVPEFAARFGATPAQIATVRSALAARGLQVGAPSANDLSLPVTATAATAEVAFATAIDRVQTAEGQVAFANRSAPQVPAAAAPLVQGVLGLDDLDVRHRHLLSSAAGESAPTGQGAAPTTSVLAPGPQPCEAALEHRERHGGYTPDEIAAAYQFDGLYASGDLGGGQTTALLEFEPFLPSDIATYQACYGTGVPIATVNVAGGPGPYQGEDGEAALDLEQLIGLSPGAGIVVYQAPNGGGAEAEALTAWVTEDRAKVMSTSWGICEPEAGAAELVLTGTLLAEAATQGQSFFAASGDSGSSDCYREQGSHDKTLAVDSPGSQPFATSVGGTRMEAPTTPPTEYIWNDGPTGGAGGGGLSAHFAMPTYQSGAAPGLNVLSAFSSGASCGSPTFCRQVPDVSADASAVTGYIVFSEGHWQNVGGTSAAAPLWAALATLANASPACSARPIGFADPALYALAGQLYGNYFDDITVGRPGGLQTNNMFNSATPFPAGPGYDMASGLGTPIAPTLASGLCALAPVPPPPAAPAPAPPVPAPGPERTHARLRHAHLGGLANGSLRLSISLAAREGARLDAITLTPPPGLVPAKRRWALAAAIIVRGESGKRLKFSARTTGRKIFIRLLSLQPTVQLTIGTPALTVTRKLASTARRGGTHKLGLVVTTRESGGKSARLSATVST